MEIIMGIRSRNIQTYKAKKAFALPEAWEETIIYHPIQARLLTDNVRFKVVPAGRRCLAEGTLVATPIGPVAIESLFIGDEVIGYNAMGEGEITTVTKTWDNGEQIVTPLISSDREYTAGTEDHKFLACHESRFDKRRPHLKDIFPYQKTKLSSITGRHRIKRLYCPELIKGGTKEVKYTYSLGALLGDGCSKNNVVTTGERSVCLYISSGDDIVPKYIANQLGCLFDSPKWNNCTYIIRYGKGALHAIPFYKEWCSGRGSHEKIVLWSEVDTWDKKTALSFLAGIIDTDGSIHYKEKDKKTEAILDISMQAKSVVEVCAKIIFKYFQEELSIGIDNRGRYKNRCVYSGKTTSNIQLINILHELDRYLVKRKGFDVSSLNIWNILPDRIGFKKSIPRLEKTYDITVNNETNLYILHKGGLVTSNSGKTFHAKRNLVLEAMKRPGMYFAAAPVRDQAKKIFWKDIGKLIPSWFMQKEPSRTELIYFLNNTSEIHVIGLDKPARIEGHPWVGGVIDEIADCKSETWDEHIRPAFDTIGLNTWAWLIGVPEGLNFYYDLYQYAITAKDFEWKGYTWKSSDLLSQKVIDAAKRQLSPRQYRQEYEAEFSIATGRVYEDYSIENHTDKTFDPELGDIIWTHDQNFTPMSSAIIQKDKDDSLFVVDEIILNSAVAKQSALEFCERYKDYKKCRVLVYGDASGRIGEKHGHTSDYIEIERILRKAGFNVQMKIPNSNPAIKDGQNSLRAKICNAKEERSLFVNPSKCKYVDKGLSTVRLKKGSTFQEEDSEYQHVTSALRYFTDFEFPVKGKYVPSGQQNWK
jgi:hypothetical protein